MKTKNVKKKNVYRKLSVGDSIKLAVLHQEQGVSCYKLAKRFKNIPERTVYRHAKKPLDQLTIPEHDQRHKNPGRPTKLNNRMERLIIRTLLRLRKDGAAFTAGKILEETNLAAQGINTRDICRCLRRHGYKYLQSRKKGLLTGDDKQLRVAWAKDKIKKPLSFWQNDVCFYFDGVGFSHKSDPAGEARAVSSMTWRRHDEGLQITTKGRKEGNGKVAKFFVAVAYKKGVVMCHHHTWTINGKNFSNMIKEEFPKVFDKCGVPRRGRKTFLMDGCPKQNAALCRDTWESKGYELVKIPVRSPDLNIIENLFHLIRKKLRDDAKEKNIMQEDWNQFIKRVEETFTNFPAKTIDNMINSMPKRLKMVIEKRGLRTKY